jgi:hypothetical protein
VAVMLVCLIPCWCVPYPPACSDEYPVSTPDYPRPRSNAGVADWASRQFKKSAAGNVAKACLLVSLEEEAAAQAAYAEADGLEANHANMRGWVLGRWVVSCGGGCRIGECCQWR